MYTRPNKTNIRYKSGALLLLVAFMFSSAAFAEPNGCPNSEVERNTKMQSYKYGIENKNNYWDMTFNTHDIEAIDRICSEDLQKKDENIKSLESRVSEETKRLEEIESAMKTKHTQAIDSEQACNACVEHNVFTPNVGSSRKPVTREQAYKKCHKTCDLVDQANSEYNDLKSQRGATKSEIANLNKELHDGNYKLTTFRRNCESYKDSKPKYIELKSTYDMLAACDYTAQKKAEEERQRAAQQQKERQDAARKTKEAVQTTKRVFGGLGF